ncbi:MAG: S9 family peptidase [Burkholderiaceae bacterium]
MTPSSARPSSASASTSAPPLSVEDLWALERLSATFALAPDGRRVVCVLTRSDLDANTSSSQLWLLPTDPDAPEAAAPRPLTRCGDKDGQPAWSPTGERIAFLARREQEGGRDATPQLYTIAADGGEARRASRFAPGIESFKWLPDGRRIVFAAWVWPGLKGAAAQARRYQSEVTERKETAYATSEPFYRHWDDNLPMGRVLHLLLLDVDTGKVSDLFEGTAWELPRDDAGSSGYDLSPDGRHIAFVHDPAAVKRPGSTLALAEIEIASRRVRTLVADAGWHFGAPRYRPDGRALAATAAQVGRRHTAFNQLALIERASGKSKKAGKAAPWRLLRGPVLDALHVDGPLRWALSGASPGSSTPAGPALFFTAEDKGRCHLWRADAASGDCRIVQPGGWVQGFELAGELIVSASDSARHPLRLHALPADGSQPPRRLESFNDALLARRALGELREVWLKGALGDPLQMWLTLPVGFDPKKKHALLQLIHGGPFAAAGDSWSQRWNTHVLAARGQVVAQVNYHGSSGFGEDFRHSIMGRQGELELIDIEAGSDWLLKQPWADAKRLSAAGGSYGGFMVAWMNGHVPAGRYRSYVCHAGVFDRVATYSADSYVDRPRDLGARYWEDLPKVLAQSPASFAAAMDTPTLVIHGARDFRVPDCNGLAHYNTLKARGVDARLLWFPDENHWVLKPRNSRLWYRELLDWVAAHAPASRKWAATSASTSASASASTPQPARRSKAAPGA